MWHFKPQLNRRTFSDSAIFNVRMLSILWVKRKIWRKYILLKGESWNGTPVKRWLCASPADLYWSRDKMADILQTTFSKAFSCLTIDLFMSLQLRYNERDGVSYHQPLDCLLDRLFRRRSKKIFKGPRHWPLLGEFTGDRWQRASNAETVSILMTSTCGSSFPVICPQGSNYY